MCVACIAWGIFGPTIHPSLRRCSVPLPCIWRTWLCLSFPLSRVVCPLISTIGLGPVRRLRVAREFRPRKRLCQKLVCYDILKRTSRNTNLELWPAVFYHGCVILHFFLSLRFLSSACKICRSVANIYHACRQLSGSTLASFPSPHYQYSITAQSLIWSTYT